MDYSEVLRKFESQLDFKNTKSQKEHRVVEQFLLEISNEKVTIFNVFKVVKKLKTAISIIGTIVSSCLSEQIELNKIQIDCLKIQKGFQKQIDELKNKIENLGG